MFDESFAELGYSVFNKVTDRDLILLRQIIIDRINQFITPTQSPINSWDELLHIYADLDVHSLISSKENRVLTHSQVNQLYTSDFYADLCSRIGDFSISNEEYRKHPEVYWRIVRPNSASDVGPLHADRWFWESNHDWTMPSSFSNRSKVWIPLQVELYKNGLLMVPQSHKSNTHNYRLVTHGSKVKPLILETSNIGETLIDTPLGSYVFFHDSVIHGGALNNGQFIRASIEFTCFYN